jgi:hypothetical protein
MAEYSLAEALVQLPQAFAADARMPALLREHVGALVRGFVAALATEAPEKATSVVRVPYASRAELEAAAAANNSAATPDTPGYAVAATICEVRCRDYVFALMITFGGPDADCATDHCLMCALAKPVAR